MRRKSSVVDLDRNYGSGSLLVTTVFIKDLKKLTEKAQYFIIFNDKLPVPF